MHRNTKAIREINMKKTNDILSQKKCGGKLSVVKKEKGYSRMQTIWGGNGHSGKVTYTSYKCQHGHEYMTTGTDIVCSDKPK